MKKDFFATILLSGVLVLINALLIWPMFLGGYDQNMGSIGIAHILNARYVSRFFFFF